MKTTAKKTLVPIVLIMSLLLSLCSGCNSNCSGLKLSPIYTAAITGAIVGGIIGYQSEEPGEGAAVGAAIFGVGQLLKEIDEQHKDRGHKDKDECKDEVVVEIHNNNGSVTPVKLKKEGCIYIGPKGEHYEKLPTEEQLRPVYGL